MKLLHAFFIAFTVVVAAYWLFDFITTGAPNVVLAICSVFGGVIVAITAMRLNKKPDQDAS